MAKAEVPPPVAPKPDVPARRPPAEPLLLAFTPPAVPRSTFSTARQDRAIHLPEDAEDRITILNGPDFRLAAVPASPQTWEVATRTGSGLGGGFSLARLNRVDARTWQFGWTKNARAKSTQVEGLEDAILEFHGGDGRPIRVLLRGVELETNRPLEVWKDQKILFERMETAHPVG